MRRLRELGSMTTTARITIDSETVSPARAIAAAARSAPLLVASHRAFRDLAAELGGHDEATRHLLAVATAVDAPIAVNVARDGGESTTACIAPKGWTEEKLRGWIGGKREAIEALFGPATIREGT